MQQSKKDLFNGFALAAIASSVLLNIALWTGKLVVSKPSETDFLSALTDAQKPK